MLDPLRPYLKAITAVVFAALAFGVFVTGCNHGKGKMADAVDAMQAERDEARGWAEASAEALAEVNREAERNLAESERWRHMAQLAVETAADVADRHADAIAEVHRELEEAKRDPTCRAQLEAPVCVAIH